MGGKTCSTRSQVREALASTTPKEKGPAQADGVLTPTPDSPDSGARSPLDVEQPCFLDDEEDGPTKPGELFGKFTWRIENFSEISKRELRSTVFEVGQYKWYILVYPQGCDVCNHLSLFLCVADYDKLLPGWSHFAQFTIAVTNKDPKKSKYSDTLHRFCKKEHDWGWKKFMELSKVLDGFTVSDTLVIKAQVQVIRDKPNKPFRCLHSGYRRELVRVYLSNVEGVCRRFCEDKRAKLAWVRDNPQRFQEFWATLPEEQQQQLVVEKAEVVLKGVIKQFFNEKEVTSTLVMDALYCGCKQLADVSRAFLEGTLPADADAPLVLLRPERNWVCLQGEVVEVAERASQAGFLPPPKAEDKNAANVDNLALRTGTEDETRKDSVERDEKRLAELGRKTVEMYMLSHICTDKVEVAYRDAEALKRQDQLILEELAQQQQEEGRRREQAEREREKKAKKKERVKARREVEQAKRDAEDAEKRRQDDVKRAELERRAQEAAAEQQRRQAQATQAQQQERLRAWSSAGGAKSSPTSTSPTSSHPATQPSTDSASQHRKPSPTSTSNGNHHADLEIKAVRSTLSSSTHAPTFVPRSNGISQPGAMQPGAMQSSHVHRSEATSNGGAPGSMHRSASTETSSYARMVAGDSQAAVASSSGAGQQVAELQQEASRLRQRVQLLEQELTERDSLVGSLRAQVAGLQTQLEQQRQQQAAAIAAAVASSNLQHAASLAASAALCAVTSHHAHATPPSSSVQQGTSVSVSVAPSTAPSNGSRHSSTSSLDRDALNELLASTSHAAMANGHTPDMTLANGGAWSKKHITPAGSARETSESLPAPQARGHGTTNAWGVRPAFVADQGSVVADNGNGHDVGATGGRAGSVGALGATGSGQLGSRRSSLPESSSKQPTKTAPHTGMSQAAIAQAHAVAHAAVHGVPPSAAPATATPQETVTPSYRNAAAGIMSSAAAAATQHTAAAASSAAQQASVGNASAAAPGQPPPLAPSSPPQTEAASSDQESEDLSRTDSDDPPADADADARTQASAEPSAAATAVPSPPSAAPPAAAAPAAPTEYQPSIASGTTTPVGDYKSQSLDSIKSTGSDAFRPAANEGYSSQRPSVLALPPSAAGSVRSGGFAGLSSTGASVGEGGGSVGVGGGTGSLLPEVVSARGATTAMDSPCLDDFAHMGIITDLLGND